MQSINIKSVILQMKSPQAKELLREEIVKEVRRAGYIFVWCKYFSPETISFLNDEGIEVTEIKPLLFLVHDCTEQVIFFVQNSPRSPEEIKESHQKEFAKNFGNDQNAQLSLEIIEL